MDELVAIVGAAGAIGRSVGAEFVRRRIRHRVIGRDRDRLEKAFGGTAEVVAADMSDERDGERALAGATAVVYAVGLPYPEHWRHPVLMHSTLHAARLAAISRLVLISSVYGYGAPRTPKVDENHPRQPHTRKGRYRKEQEDIVLTADLPDGLRTLVLRLPDFYGPNAENSLADQVFQGALKGKPAIWMGPVDLPHEFVFVPDVGPVVADLMERSDSFGQAWNFGGPGTITGREFIGAVYAAAGRKPQFRSTSKWMLRLGGLFNPLLRELVEMHYLSTTPVILDDSKLARHLGTLHKTRYAEGIKETMEWYSARAGT